MKDGPLYIDVLQAPGPRGRDRPATQKSALFGSLSYVSRVLRKTSESVCTTRSRSISTPIGWFAVVADPRVVLQKRRFDAAAVVEVSCACVPVRARTMIIVNTSAVTGGSCGGRVSRVGGLYVGGEGGREDVEGRSLGGEDVRSRGR